MTLSNTQLCNRNNVGTEYLSQGHPMGHRESTPPQASESLRQLRASEKEQKEDVSENGGW